MSETITLPRDVVAAVLEKLGELQDAGPVPEGWKSDELLALIAAIEEALDIPKAERWRSFGL